MYKCFFEGPYRYSLEGKCDWAAKATGGRVAWICLNPSYDDEYHLCRALTRVKNFSRDWGFCTFVVLNLFSYITSQPKDLNSQVNPIGPCNDDSIQRELARSREVICAWGDGAGVVGFKKRERDVLEMLSGRRLYCLDMTKKGHPRHPLYAAQSLTRRVFLRTCQGVNEGS